MKKLIDIFKYFQCIFTLSVNMMSTVKITPKDKDTLERLQAKLKLQTNKKIDQYKLLGHLIKFGNNNFNKFFDFLEQVTLTDEEIEEIKNKYVGSYVDKHPDKTDDELIYGE